MCRAAAKNDVEDDDDARRLRGTRRRPPGRALSRFEQAVPMASPRLIYSWLRISISSLLAKSMGIPTRDSQVANTQGVNSSASGARRRPGLYSQIGDDIQTVLIACQEQQQVAARSNFQVER
ncbi:hypothetical protein VTN00DRAFT_5912 [Thermoascus crustaceus]|uniref:uncharacterized protein n=1 Tax=Thermoascus crustaceus TaxID=5088 RepID=UPI00374297B0